MGRPKVNQQITDGTTYQMKYVYNLSGQMVEEEYPSGRKVKNDLDANGDIARIYGNATATATEKTYANGFAYTVDGKIQKLRLGNGRWESAKFNSNLQATEIALGTSDGNGSLWKINYEYGELNATNGTVDTSKNTGNVAKQTIDFNGMSKPFVQTYKYDSLYRITEAKEMNDTMQTWIQTYGYDKYGNRTAFSQNVHGNNLTMDNVTLPAVNAATNRFNGGQGYEYDKIGNLKKDVTKLNGVTESRDITFNGDNKQIEIKDTNTGKKIGEYFYDGSGKRVKKRLFDGNNQPLEDVIFVYSGDKLVAEYSTTPKTNPKIQYVATDTLGSVRAITDQYGQIVSRRDFMPFGEELQADTTYRKANLKYNSDDVRQKFTGYQKDEETGLDFAEARMYNNSHARFTAVDPLLASGKSANPQSFNRYVYVMNNPLAYTDPDGLCSKPSNLKVGQVGICVEAFIAAEKINGVGHGDGRGHDGNNPDLTARMRISFVVSASLTDIDVDPQEKTISGSSASLPIPAALSTGGAGTVNKLEIPLGTYNASGSVNAVYDKENSKNQRGVEGFGEATKINVSLQNGKNGVLVAGEGLSNMSGSATDGRPLAKAGSAIAGAIVTAVAPKGTIDLNATITISGSGNNITVVALPGSRESREYPSYTGYAYIRGADGNVRTIELFKRDETVPENLPKPITQF